MGQDMASDFAIWDACNGRYAVLTMHTGRCWDVTIEDLEKGTEIMRYGAFGDSAFEVAQSAMAYLPEGTTLDLPVQEYETAEAATDLNKVILEREAPEVEGSVYAHGM